MPSVTFKPEPDAHMKVEQVGLPADGSVTAAAVTVEPEAESPQPATSILLMGSAQKS